MKQIVLFDIDRTIFDSDAFLLEFYQKLEKEFNLKGQKKNLPKIYLQSRPKGYFNPQLFLREISETFDLNLAEVNDLFWNQNSIERHLYKDANAILKLSKKVKIGIFSKGYFKFQKSKIKRFEKVINEKDTYIVPDKVKSIAKVLNKYSNFKIYLVDDEAFLLEKAKNYNPKIFTILINRDLPAGKAGKKAAKNDKIDAQMKSLSEIYKFL